MYLGQLVKLRDALSREVVVVIDERDARDIAKHEDVDEDEVEQSNAVAKEVQVSKQVSVYVSCIMNRAHDSTGSSSYCRQLSRCVGESQGEHHTDRVSSGEEAKVCIRYH